MEHGEGGAEVARLQADSEHQQPGGERRIRRQEGKDDERHRAQVAPRYQSRRRPRITHRQPVADIAAQVRTNRASKAENQRDAEHRLSDDHAVRAHEERGQVLSRAQTEHGRDHNR